MKLGIYNGDGVVGNRDNYGLLLPPRFISKYKKLITRAGFKVTKIVKNPFPGVAVPYTFRGHQMLMVKIDSHEQHVKLSLLAARWEKMLENEN